MASKAADKGKRPQFRRTVSSTSFRDHQLAVIFNSLDADKKGYITAQAMQEALSYQGLHPSIVQNTMKFLDRKKSGRIEKEDMVRLKDMETPIVERALKKELIFPDFAGVAKDLEEVTELTRANVSGKNADYIPQLARADPDHYGVAVCSVDAQCWQTGDVDIQFTVQSTSKPITYCMVQELIGSEKLTKHVGNEPSGRAFNAYTLDKFNRPHNPMINLGAIMTASLLHPTLEQAERFDTITKVWGDLAASPVSFDNATYLSELEHADRNFSLAYMAKDVGAFDRDVAGHQDITKQLQFYFMCCSLMVNCSQASIIAATLANGGVNPLTQKRVFSSSTVRDCLSLMYSCGMYDYSGQFAYEVGLPAKSGVAGLVLLVVPGVMGVAVWSPRLDSYGNSARGVEFCRRLTQKYTFHMFHGIGSVSVTGAKDPTRAETRKDSVTAICELNFAAAAGDLPKVISLANEGASLNSGDYDGRTPLHLAVCEDRIAVIKYLLSQGASAEYKDRWQQSPLDEARSRKNETVIKLLEASLETSIKTE